MADQDFFGDQVDIKGVRVNVSPEIKKGKKMTKEEKINLLVAQDMVSVRESMVHGDYEYFYCILTGDGFTPYFKLTNAQLDREFNERWDDIKGNFEVLTLADKINEKPINKRSQSNV